MSKCFNYSLVYEMLQSSHAEKDLKVLVDSNLNMSQPCAQAARKTNHILWYIKHGIASQLREGIVLL